MLMKKAGFISSPLSSPVARGLRQAALLLEQHHAEAVESCVPEGLAVLGRVHAEAARTTGAGGQEHEAIDDLFGAHALLVAQVNQHLHQVTDREVRRVTLRAVAELLADAERVVVRSVECHDVVAAALESTGDEVVVGQGEAADQHGDLGALALGEGEVGHLLHPLFAIFEPEPRALGSFERS
jgi:hypothetical protein